jgi:NADH-ubiquinone oxidoreductase chain 5
MTKSAIFPFSPWLPLAIAAPTPISALVHSSTLVTSGLFLMMRFSYLFYSSYQFLVFFICLSVYTSFYAGFNTIFEKDLKKLIALSTLSHLGFIGLAFSSGCLYLSFFHLLVHAFFKSLLFITIGDIIINQSHAQEIRYLSAGISYTPFSSSIMYISLLNLSGLPRLRGFFSKDLILEALNYSYARFFIYALVVLNLFFTFYYTFQLFYYTFQLNKLSPYFVFNSPHLFHSLLMFSLSLVTMLFGYVYLSLIFPFFIFVPVPFLLKFIPILLLLVFLLFVYSKKSLLNIQSPTTSFIGSSMLLLSFVTTTLSSQIFFSLSRRLSKETEQGFLYYRLNTVASTIVTVSSKLIISPSTHNPLFVILMCFPLVFMFTCFL